MLCLHYREIRNLDNLRSLRIKKTQALYKILADNLKKTRGLRTFSCLSAAFGGGIEYSKFM
jgi:hypothetical protein